jgi:hypothetical protein
LGEVIYCCRGRHFYLQNVVTLRVKKEEKNSMAKKNESQRSTEIPSKCG